MRTLPRQCSFHKRYLPRPSKTEQDQTMAQGHISRSPLFIFRFMQLLQRRDIVVNAPYRRPL